MARKPSASPALALAAGVSTANQREAKGRGGGASFGNNKRATLELGYTPEKAISAKRRRYVIASLQWELVHFP